MGKDQGDKRVYFRIREWLKDLMGLNDAPAGYDFTAFGDSITAGTKVKPPALAWANRLGCPDNKAESGARVVDMWQIIRREKPKARHTYTIMIGTNDHWYYGHDEAARMAFVNTLRACITWLIVPGLKPGPKILVSNIISMSDAAYALMGSSEENVQAYNNDIADLVASLRLATSADIRLVDNHRAVHRAFHLSPDGIHPSAGGHYYIAENFMREMER